MFEFATSIAEYKRLTGKPPGKPMTISERLRMAEPVKQPVKRYDLKTPKVKKRKLTKSERQLEAMLKQSYSNKTLAKIFGLTEEQIEKRRSLVKAS